MKGNKVTNEAFSWGRLITWLLLGLVLSGCADLSAIRKFANISMEAENYKKITEDSVNIQERMEYYQEPKDKADFEKFKKDMEKLKPGILALNQWVSEYMKALGELANDKLIPYDKSLFEDLKGEVDKSLAVKRGYISQETVVATADLADLLTKAITEAYRQAKLQEIISKANAPLQTILSDQKKIIGCYKTNLNTELYYGNAYYGQIITEFQVIFPKDERKISQSKSPMNDTVYYLGNVIWDKKVPLEKRAALGPLRNELQAKLIEYNTRKKAADDYLSVLDNIKKGHQQLYDMRYQIKSEALLSIINSYSAEIQKLYQDLIALK
jgi:hypothetical protein